MTQEMIQEMTRVLIVFARTPVPGMTKTRLASVLGDQQAADAHRELVAGQLQRLAGCTGCERQLWVTEDGAEPQDWAARHGLGLHVQCDGDLGDRMAYALDHALQAGAGAACLVGTDCPELDGDYVGTAFEALAAADVVFGPAEDGGYGLVGLSTACPELFTGIQWGRGDVLARSLAAGRDAGRKVALLKTLWDVDTASDWRRYLAWRDAQSGSALRDND